MTIKARLFSLDASAHLKQGSGWLLLVLLGFLGTGHAACTKQTGASRLVADQATVADPARDSAAL